MEKSFIKPDDPKLREMLAYLGVPESASDVTITVNDIIGVIVNARYHPVEPESPSRGYCVWTGEPIAEKPHQDNAEIPDGWTPADEPPDVIRNVQALMSDRSKETAYYAAPDWSILVNGNEWAEVTPLYNRHVVAWREIEAEHDALKPCPFCGAKTVDDPTGHGGFVACDNCGALGPDAGELSARDAWNRRK